MRKLILATLALAACDDGAANARTAPTAPHWHVEGLNFVVEDFPADAKVDAIPGMIVVSVKGHDVGYFVGNASAVKRE